jgi:D-amino-acid oxidase
MAAVVGCGIIGLTSALRLLEAGHEVTIYVRDLPPRTTSDTAAAIAGVATAA